MFFSLIALQPFSRTPTPKEASVEAALAKKARVSRWGGASVGASPRVFRGGEASDGASPCESRGASKGSSGMVELV